MSYATERSDIETHIKNQLAASAISTWPVGYDGHAFAAVANSLRLTILPGGSEQMTMGAPGSNLSRHAGAILIQIFTSGGVGSVSDRAATDIIAAMFRNQTIGAVRCRLPYVSGVIEDAPFRVTTLAIPFERDEYNA